MPVPLTEENIKHLADNLLDAINKITSWYKDFELLTISANDSRVHTKALDLKVATGLQRLDSLEADVKTILTLLHVLTRQAAKK